ncbi:hypothetical protein Mp_6g15480 [Marchantia polymorpha subsp. ruderalis]|uniref:Uncharacterized protein n=2 Tax=Marchantia polymorpha TaxID=3197 RepID=A0AAF6BSD0_MARPO|nr:hypothetical protein MARPO_0056s0060 [Marchantia polymorpha]BBN14914.1 hypothetical protein Mp_6g15480 [Marchantia polymorpha subsp. ruderalis]|eukprot:PTQ37598.1 hypothetical protein MARPO_0056s0060 [Marchantia polymorpha]
MMMMMMALLVVVVVVVVVGLGLGVVVGLVFLVMLMLLCSYEPRQARLTIPLPPSATPSRAVKLAPVAQPRAFVRRFSELVKIAPRPLPSHGEADKLSPRTPRPPALLPAPYAPPRTPRFTGPTPTPAPEAKMSCNDHTRDITRGLAARKKTGTSRGASAAGHKWGNALASPLGITKHKSAAASLLGGCTLAQPLRLLPRRARRRGLPCPSLLSSAVREEEYRDVEAPLGSRNFGHAARVLIPCRAPSHLTIRLLPLGKFAAHDGSNVMAWHGMLCYDRAWRLPSGQGEGGSLDDDDDDDCCIPSPSPRRRRQIYVTYLDGGGAGAPPAGELLSMMSSSIRFVRASLCSPSPLPPPPPSLRLTGRHPF